MLLSNRLLFMICCILRFGKLMLAHNDCIQLVFSLVLLNVLSLVVMVFRV